MPKEEEHRNFFHLRSAENWKFYNYFVATHNDINKFKKFNTIRTDYLEDLDCIARSNASPEIQIYAKGLKRNIARCYYLCAFLPDKATTKATKARRISKSLINNQGIVIYGGTNTIQDNNFYSNTNEADSGSAISNYGANKMHLSDEDKEKQKEEEKRTKKKGKMTEEVYGIWKDWVAFMQNGENIKKFYSFSPEYHNVIRVGHIVSWRPNLDEKLYKQHLEEKKDKLFALPASTVDYISLVIDSKMRDIPDDDENEIVFDFLEAIFRAYHDIYSCKQDIEDGEATFNDLLIVPFLKAIANVIAKETSSGAEFKVGEAPLIAMKKQLKNDDDVNLYRAYSIIKLYSLRELEILLLETSCHFGSKDKTKASFDHHKGLFGALSMLKFIADEFYLGTIEVFSKLKALFKSVGALDLDTKFDKTVEQLPKAFKFYWTVKCLLQQTVDAVRELEVEHKKILKQYRFTSFPAENMSSFVNPSIMKLTKAEDKAGMSEIGPFLHLK
ncbi:hypothetical protein RMATCC62417_16464 [Rhizopus microsporus]|nr:hypothetical protein RMATCC62417_16464 [Rhizopus microsporus]